MEWNLRPTHEICGWSQLAPSPPDFHMGGTPASGGMNESLLPWRVLSKTLAKFLQESL
jgi:hypothetical protein